MIPEKDKREGEEDAVKMVGNKVVVWYGGVGKKFNGRGSWDQAFAAATLQCVSGKTGADDPDRHVSYPSFQASGRLFLLRKRWRADPTGKRPPAPTAPPPDSSPAGQWPLSTYPYCVLYALRPGSNFLPEVHTTITVATAPSPGL
jgi:hypothetical protein